MAPVADVIAIFAMHAGDDGIVLGPGAIALRNVKRGSLGLGRPWDDAADVVADHAADAAAER